MLFRTIALSAATAWLVACGGQAKDAPAETSSTPVAQTTSAPANATPADGKCSLISNAQVEDVVHLSVARVEADDEKCTFDFAGSSGANLTIYYGATGGADQLDTMRKTQGAAHAILGGIAGAATGGSNDSASQTARSIAGAITSTSDVTKVGDDQMFIGGGQLGGGFIARKGDAWVQVGVVMLPKGVSAEQALPELAQRVFASHS
ncbi:MAG: hypothetical protein ABI231_08705 [Candidatus Tumulicola sp.]